MKDKFKVNIKFAMPAAIIVIIIFSLLTSPYQEAFSSNAFTLEQIISLLPYLSIFVLAIIGINVFAVLLIGIVLAAVIGMTMHQYLFSAWISDINQGFANMQDIFILSLLIGGLSELIKSQGALVALSEQLTKWMKALASKSEKQAAVLAIASLSFICNVFTANNTVSIITVGDTAKNIADKAKITPAHSASSLDVYSCISQGLLPYGAQALLLGATFNISPVTIVSYAFYPMLLFVFASLWFAYLTKEHKGSR